jgi:hypothetical protein
MDEEESAAALKAGQTWQVAQLSHEAREALMKNPG